MSGSSEQTTTNTVNTGQGTGLVNQGLNTAGNALGSLEQLLGPDNDLIANLDPLQLQGIQSSLEGLGQIPGIQNFLQNIMQNGAGIGSDSTQFLQNQLTQGLPQSTLDTLNQQVNVDPTAQSALQNAATTSALDPAIVQALQSQLGPAFRSPDQTMIDAAVRSAQPGVASAFGGRVGSALALENLGQVAVDNFAQQSLQRAGLQQNAAGALGGLNLNDRGQQQSAALGLGGLNLNAAGQNTNRAGLLGQLQGQQGQLQQGAAGLLGNFDIANSNAQFGAANALPGLSQFVGQTQLGLGGLLQGQAQNEINAPISAQSQLFNAANSIPGATSPLFGQTQTQSRDNDPLSQALGLGLGGAAIFSGFPAIGPALGGLFGLGGGQQQQASNDPFDIFAGQLG